MEDAREKSQQDEKVGKSEGTAGILREFEVDRFAESVLAKAYELLLRPGFVDCGQRERRRVARLQVPNQTTSVQGGYKQ